MVLSSEKHYMFYWTFLLICNYFPVCSNYRNLHFETKIIFIFFFSSTFKSDKKICNKIFFIAFTSCTVQRNGLNQGFSNGALGPPLRPRSDSSEATNKGRFYGGHKQVALQRPSQVLQNSSVTISSIRQLNLNL